MATGFTGACCPGNGARSDTGGAGPGAGGGKVMGRLGGGTASPPPTFRCSSGRSAAPLRFPLRSGSPVESDGQGCGEPPAKLREAAHGEKLGTVRRGAMERGGFSPEKVIFAIEFAFPGEAFLGEVALALAALDAFDVPCPVQDVQQEPVQNRPLAARTMHHHNLRRGWRRANEKEKGRKKKNHPVAGTRRRLKNAGKKPG